MLAYDKIGDSDVSVIAPFSGVEFLHSIRLGRIENKNLTTKNRLRIVKFAKERSLNGVCTVIKSHVS